MIRSGLKMAVMQAISALAFCSLASADDPFMASTATAPAIEPAATSMAYSGSDDGYQFSFGHKWSEELGWSLHGAAALQLTEAAALGLLVEYGNFNREYLANAGIQLADTLRFVGTVGLLEQHHNYDEEREAVQQMEYGISLKGLAASEGFGGLELNGYLVNADSDSDSLQTGKLHGVQLLSSLRQTGVTQIRLGVGYEWLKWDSGEDHETFSFRAEGKQALTETMSLNANVKLGASENVYGAGLALDMRNHGAENSMIDVSYSHIDGKQGIADDQRVMLTWTLGLASSNIAETANADAATVLLKNDMLHDVMERPAYLPETVIAAAGEAASCQYTHVGFQVFSPGDTALELAPYGSGFAGGVIPAIIHVRINGTLYPLNQGGYYSGVNPAYYGGGLPRRPTAGDMIIICGVEVVIGE